ncbi:MAG: universal stress protein [Bacteroidales bacterium]|nr:universal stress protein [Bacteroidales bacterium]
MKDILVAIDFSKGSAHALEYAIDLANVAQSNVIMIWVDNLLPIDSQLAAEAAEGREEAKKNLDELVQHYKGSLKPGKLSFKIRKGKVYQELAAQAKASDCSMLVTGTHGVTGFEEYWIGSNAARVVSYSPCPVATVKFNYEINRGIRKIILPIDHTTQTVQKAHFTAALAKSHGADINILALHTSRLKTMQRVVDNNVAKLEKFLTSQGINYIIDTIMTDNLANTIIDHARLVDADLIAIMTDWQNEASVTILGQFAQQLVNYSPVPVLSIPPKDQFIL